jgi:signal recognition particle receptor subunit beta
MSFINYAKKEINLKIVYMGTGMSGKTTNIQYLYDHAHGEKKGDLVTLSGENERTLFFDFLPLTIGEVGGFQTRFHLYTLPGQVFYDLSQLFILKGVDGVIFVVDSQRERMEDNIEAFERMKKNLKTQGYELENLPLVFQYNKRDCSSAVPVGDLRRTFNTWNRPEFEATAHKGHGVMETLQALATQVIRDLKRGETQ